MKTTTTTSAPAVSRNAQRSMRLLGRLKRLSRLLTVLLVLLVVVVVLKVVNGQFDQPKTYYEYQLQTWNQVLLKKPKDPVARTRVAQIYLKMGQDGRAISMLQSIIKDNPKYISAYYYMALAKQKQGLLAQAEKNYLKTISLGKNNQVNAMPAYRLAGIYEKRGQTDKAVKYYEITAAGEPLMWNPHFKLGVLYEKKGQTQKALDHYRQAAQFNQSKKLKETISKLEKKAGK